MTIPAHAGSVQVNVNADARIRGGGSANANFGSDNLFAKANTSLGVSRKFYLAFDVSSLAGTPYSSVELVLTKQNTDGSAPTSVVHNAFGITDNGDWDTGSLLESAITWNNAPNNATGSATGFVDQGSTSSDASRFLDGETVFKADASGTEYRFDVTDYVNWAIGENNSYSSFATSDSDEIITFMIAWDSVIGGDTYTFHSKETNSLLAPRLEAEMVPLPAGLWLGLTGILGVVVLRRRAW